MHSITIFTFSCKFTITDGAKYSKSVRRGSKGRGRTCPANLPPPPPPKKEGEREKNERKAEKRREGIKRKKEREKTK